MLSKIKFSHTTGSHAKLMLQPKLYYKHNQANIFMCLFDHVYPAPFANLKIECRGVARNTFNVGEVWNPVCCHGKKIFKPKL